MNFENILKEIRFKTSRSGGAGGQHVNKVESKVTLLWNFEYSQELNVNEKSLIRYKLNNRIQGDGLLFLDVQESRSQIANKKIAIEKLRILINNSLTVDKERIKTKIPRAVIIARLDRKSKVSEKKRNRNWRID